MPKQSRLSVVSTPAAAADPVAFAHRCATDLPLIRSRVTVLTMAMQRAGETEAAQVLMRDVDDALFNLEEVAKALAAADESAAA
jgi:hypothetical protein